MIQTSWVQMTHFHLYQWTYIKSHACSVLWPFCGCVNFFSHQSTTRSGRPPEKKAAPKEAPFQDIFLWSLVARVPHPYCSALPQSGSGYHQCIGAVISLNCTLVAPYYERKCECCQSPFLTGNGITGQKTSLASINYQAHYKRELTDETGISMSEQYSFNSKTADWVFSLPA